MLFERTHKLLLERRANSRRSKRHPDDEGELDMQLESRAKIFPETSPPDNKGEIQCRDRLGGMLKYYYRAA